MSSKPTKEKQEFIFKDHSFKLVSMRVFDTKLSNILHYTLLVIDDVMIYDFKVQVEKMTLTMETTASHQETKKYNNELFLRKEIFSNLSLQHSFVKIDGKKKIKQPIVKQEKLNKLNNFFWDRNWEDITFQNIEYLITGSNPTGQGNTKSFFKTAFNSSHYPFGFLFQWLNQTDAFYKKYENKSYPNSFFQEYWDENFENFPKDVTFERCSFEQWISQNKMLKSFFRNYADAGTPWQNTDKDIEQELKIIIHKLTVLDEKVNNLRQQQKKKVLECFNDLRNWSNEIFGNEKAYVEGAIEFAHVHSVANIKKLSSQKEDETEACDTLEEISSQYNCLPLNSTLHTLYDKNHIYWDNDGKLCFGSNYSDKESDMFIPFKQINPEYLPLIQPFLKKRNSIVGNTTIQKPSYKKSF